MRVLRRMVLLLCKKWDNCLYKKPKFESKEVAEGGTDSESNDGDDVEEFQIVREEGKLKMTDNLHSLIRKVRTIVKMSLIKRIFCKNTLFFRKFRIL